MTSFACNLAAISPADRRRYQELVERLRAAIVRQEELAEGYSFELDNAAFGVEELNEWMSMERLCCPFLFFQSSPSGASLQITGPAGTKLIVSAAFSGPAAL